MIRKIGVSPATMGLIEGAKHYKGVDARYMTRQEQYERRLTVCRLYEDGLSIADISYITGISHPTLSVLIRKFRDGGYEAIKTSEKVVQKITERQFVVVGTIADREGA